MRRISIIGNCGSGKTTLARHLSLALSIPHIEMDAVYWQPNWQPRSAEEIRESLEKAVAGEEWIVDGNYGKLRPLYLSRATVVIWLNYSFPTTFARLWRRTLRRVFRRELLYGNNHETFRQAFCSRQSIFWHMCKTFRRRRREYRELFNDKRYAHVRRIEIRDPREAESLAAQLERDMAESPS